MSKFCTACGASIADEATFCTNCGAPQAPNAAPQQPAGTDSAAFSMLNAVNNNQGMNPPPYQPGPLAAKPGLSDKAKKILILCIAGAAALTVIIILLIILLGGGYKKPIDNLIKSLESGTGEAYLKVLPDSVANSIEEDHVERSSKYDTLEEYFDDVFESYNSSLADRYGDDFSITYSVADKKEITESRLKSYASNYKSYYGKKVDVSAGYTLSLEVTWKGSEKDEDGDKSIIVLKVDGDWVLWDAEPSIMMPRKLGGTNNSSGSSDLSDYDLDDIDVDDILDYFS